MIETHAAPSNESAKAARSSTPPASTGTAVDARTRWAAQRSTALCSMADTTAAPGPVKASSERRAVLTLSVPPLVKTISSGSAPTSAATCSRACSMARRASLAAAYEPDGLAKPSRNHGSMASSTSGSSGVVALAST